MGVVDSNTDELRGTGSLTPCFCHLVCHFVFIFRALLDNQMAQLREPALADWHNDDDFKSSLRICIGGLNFIHFDGTAESISLQAMPQRWRKPCHIEVFALLTNKPLATFSVLD